MHSIVHIIQDSSPPPNLLFLLRMHDNNFMKMNTNKHSAEERRERHVPSLFYLPFSCKSCGFVSKLCRMSHTQTIHTHFRIFFYYLSSSILLLHLFFPRLSNCVHPPTKDDNNNQITAHRPSNCQPGDTINCFLCIQRGRTN